MLYLQLIARLKGFACVSLLILGSCLPAFATEPRTITVPPWGVGANQQNPYFHQLLALALAKTEAEEGPIRVRVSPENLSGTRVMADLKNNVTVDVVWNGTSRQREQELQPIYIPLLKELNEYRVLLIRKEDQEKFSQIKSLADLRKFTAGTGADWPSTDILRLNDLPLIKVNNTSLLFPMLKAKRFDYISRNLSEAWDEAKAFEKEGLVIESSLLLHGGVPFYFFLNHDNEKLALRIERGLQIAIADGSFDEVFYRQEGFRKGQEIISDSNRLVLPLKVQ